MLPVVVKEPAQNFSNKKLSIIRIETLGCRLNQIESESAARIFLDSNFSVSMDGVTAKSPEDLETLLCIVNTCTVTQKAEQKARRIIRLLLKKYPNAAVLVTGCYAQLSKDEIQSLDSRIVVLPGQIKSRLADVPKFLRDVLDESSNSDLSKIAAKFIENLNNNLFAVPQQRPGFPEDSFRLSTSSFLAHSRASLKIQDGCNNACSYCAIHFARGHSVSIDVQTALDRVIELEKNGQSEVVITTINIAQYKSTYNGQEYNFARLLEKMLEVTKTLTFRISSLYPEIVDEEFCKVISNPRVCPHFHISVQSGSNKILKSMNRVYNDDDVIRACQKLREAKPEVFLACDIITGFPGETDEDFAQTMEVCKKCDFAWVHAFPYSERPGTPAAVMKNKVPQSVSGERAAKLTAWAIEQKIKYISAFEGRELQAVVETFASNTNDTKKYHAMTKNFIHCEFESEKNVCLNSVVTLKIVSPLPERIKKGGEIEAVAELVTR